MNCSLEGRVAWVTGGSEGIGRAICKAMAASGAKVAVTGRDQGPIDETVAALREAGGEAIGVPCDVLESDQVRDAVDRVASEWGRLDCVVANAGTNGTWAPVEEITPEEWDLTLGVNLRGTYLCAHHAARHLKKQGGSFLIVASINGTRVFSNTGASAYATSKAGQLAFGKMLALEWAPSKVRVNVVCPGAIDTGIHEKTNRRDLDEVTTPVEFPEGNMPLIDDLMGDPAKVASAAVFLASDAASLITGTPIWVDGAESLLQG